MQNVVTQYLIGGGAFLILSAAARALPPPLPGGSRWYLWFSNFCAGLLANYDRLSAAKDTTPVIVVAAKE